MSKINSLTRQQLIVRCLQKKPSTFDEIAFYLENRSDYTGQYDCSLRTFQRDVQEIYQLLGIEIAYSKSNKVWEITAENTNNIAARLLESYDIYRTISNFEHANKYVHFSKRKAQGTEHIYDILNAINQKRCIKITHYNYWSNESKAFIVAPYVIKENNGRWYLIALSNEKVLTFGLDRITELITLKQKFVYPKDFSVEQLFEHSFGIIGADEELPQTIKFITNAYKANYFMSMPLHASQTTKPLPNEQVEISIKVVPTYDLTMELLSHGKEIQVVAPKGFVKEIKRLVEEMGRMYE